MKYLGNMKIEYNNEIYEFESWNNTGGYQVFYFDSINEIDGIRRKIKVHPNKNFKIWKQIKEDFHKPKTN